MKKTKAIACALFGHSRIVTNCVGFKNCGRCGEQVGDSLAGVWDGSGAVVIGHNCAECRKNFAALSWRDKFLTPNPFGETRRQRFSNWLKRRWGIRHVRWVVLTCRCHEFADNCRQTGLGLGIPNESDVKYLDRVWDGTEP